MYNDEDQEQEEEEEYGTGNKFKDFYENNKKLIWIAGIVLGFFLILTIISKLGGNGGNSGGLAIVYNNSVVEKISVAKNGTTKLEAKQGNNVVNASWSSSDNMIATVNDGYVRGVSVGTATIMASNGGKTVRCSVTVVEGNTGVTLSNSKFPDGDLLLSVGSSYSFDLENTPSDGYIETKSFTSDNPSIATVDDSGIVKGIKVGSTKISVNVNNKFRDTIVVRVVDKQIASRIVTSVTGVTFANALDKVGVGQTKKLEFQMTPANADAATIIWKSNNEKVVTVDEDGNVTGVTVGTGLIEATTLSGIKIGTISVQVEDGVMNLPTALSLEIGNQQTVTLSGNLSDTTRKTLTYVSSNPSVASVVSNDGGKTIVITGLSSGTTNISINSGNVEKNKITVTVIGGGGSIDYNPEPATYDQHQNKYYKISSKDAEGNGYVNWTYEKAGGNGNCGKGPIVITFSDFKSEIDSLKVCTYEYGKTKCDPANGTTKQSGGTITLNTKGNWVIMVNQYKGTKKVGVTLDWHVCLGSGNGTTVDGNKTVESDACYVNATSQGNGNSYKWKTKGETIDRTQSKTTLTKTQCTLANSGKLCFKKKSDGSLVWGSNYSTLSGYEFVNKNKDECGKEGTKENVDNNTAGQGTTSNTEKCYCNSSKTDCKWTDNAPGMPFTLQSNITSYDACQKLIVN